MLQEDFFASLYTFMFLSDTIIFCLDLDFICFWRAIEGYMASQQVRSSATMQIIMKSSSSKPNQKPLKKGYKSVGVNYTA